MSRPMTAEYALYKGEDLLCVGTVREIAEEMGVTEKTVYWWNTPTNKVKRAAKKKATNNRKYLIRIEDDDEQDC